MSCPTRRISTVRPSTVWALPYVMPQTYKICSNAFNVWGGSLAWRVAIFVSSGRPGFDSWAGHVWKTVISLYSIILRVFKWTGSAFEVDRRVHGYIYCRLFKFALSVFPFLFVSLFHFLPFVIFAKYSYLASYAVKQSSFISNLAPAYSKVTLFWVSVFFPSLLHFMFPLVPHTLSPDLPATLSKPPSCLNLL